MNVLKFKQMKQEKRKISMITCYDYGFAQLVDGTQVDCLLVGDSLAMVQHGHTSTLPATPALMALHVRAVARGAPNKFIVGDMPFLAHRKGLSEVMDAVQEIMAAGAHALKIEGAHPEIMAHIVDSGVPVMGHLGLTPQSINQLGGFKVQGKQAGAEEWLTSQAQAVEEAGCFAVVLECVPRQVARAVTEKIPIPTIGIGAGPDVDGQVLVINDLLGLNLHFKPKFLRTYLNGAELIQEAFNRYDLEVKSGAFPSDKESY